MKWGLSPLDWRSHAINERADHPSGVLIADCDHRPMIIATPAQRTRGEAVPDLRRRAARAANDRHDE
jgi:hypothetical protein